MSKILRFAPSLSGSLHIGSMKILIANFLFATANKWKVILRFDDTDQERCYPESFSNISTIINIFGLSPNKTVFQSSYFKRIAHYNDKLTQSNKAYYCRCEQYIQRDCQCKDARLASGRLVLDVASFAEHAKIKDLLMGKEVTFKDIYNVVLTRTNGFPLYNYMTVISDIEESVSLIIRGNDHLINTWKQVLIYQALDEESPQYLHLPMILNSEKKKMSKSEGEKNEVVDLLKSGHTVMALINYLAFTITGNEEECMKAKTIEDYSCESSNLFIPEQITKFSKSNVMFNENKLTMFTKADMQEEATICSKMYMYCFMNRTKAPETIMHKNINKIICRHQNLQSMREEMMMFEEDFFPKDYGADAISLVRKHKESLLAWIEDTNTASNIPSEELRTILTGKKSGMSLQIMLSFFSQASLISRIRRALELIKD